jgi:DNA polymerase
VPPAEPGDPRGELAGLVAGTASLLRWCRRHRLLTGTGQAAGRVAGSTAPGTTVAEPPDSAAEVSVADGLEAVAAEVAACRRCALGAGRKNAVPGEGSARARLMVIGEAPGATEDASGRPFVGEAGQMLTRMLENVLKIPRGQVFITNIVKCRPPGNRDPQADEVEACSGYLRRQVALVAPRAILCLGRLAAQNLLGVTTPISVLRGSRKSWNGVAVFPTFHPAYLLRITDEKEKQAKKVLVNDDLLALKSFLEGDAGP